MFFVRRRPGTSLQEMLDGFAAGIMVAASVWSLLIPAIDQSRGMGKLSFLPAAAGFWMGILFLHLLDHVIPLLTRRGVCHSGQNGKMKKTTMTALAVTLHNIPEGMAVGVIFAGVISKIDSITMAGAMILSAGIAVQNIPEGAIISMPLHSRGMGKGKSFLMGTLSGTVEPVASAVTILISWFVIPLLPYMLGFASGAMFYVVITELIPEMCTEGKKGIGLFAFSFGFTVMMAMDVALG